MSSNKNITDILRETQVTHLRRFKKMFNVYCYISKMDGTEEYEVLCTESKPDEKYVAESKNILTRSVLLRVLLEDLENAKNLLDEDNSQCPINDFSNYKINYNGKEYTVYRVMKNGSFDTIREIYCKEV